MNHYRVVFSNTPSDSYNTGNWVEDQRSGHGTYTYPNGDTYSGEWLNNLREGAGTYTYAATGSSFNGVWARDRRSGAGTISHANHKFNGHFVDDLVRLAHSLISFG
jgi:radial spoke head protein 1